MATSVLIADDDPHMLMTLDYLLKREGYEVHLARDGVEAMAALKQVRPQLLVLDVVMPRKDGYEVCQALRADAELSDTRVLMISTLGRDTDVARGLGVGADAYLTKPFSTQALTQKARDLLGTVSSDT